MLSDPTTDSTAWIDAQARTVAEIGGSSPWRDLTAAHEVWETLGRPGLTTLTLSIDETGRHHVERTGYGRVAI